METLSDAAVERLRTEYFADPDVGTYALLDGAATPAIVDRLYDDAAAFTCLLTGELEPDMQEVAPYLVALKSGDPFTQWILANGFGSHWGIVLRSRHEMSRLARHFRQLLFVRDPEEELLYFRYYDPRVLRVYLPTCAGEDIWQWFDLVDCYLVEGAEPTTLLRLSSGSDGVRTEEITL